MEQTSKCNYVLAQDMLNVKNPDLEDLYDSRYVCIYIPSSCLTKNAESLADINMNDVLNQSTLNMVYLVLYLINNPKSKKKPGKKPKNKKKKKQNIQLLFAEAAVAGEEEESGDGEQEEEEEEEDNTTSKLMYITEGGKAASRCKVYFEPVYCTTNKGKMFVHGYRYWVFINDPVLHLDEQLEILMKENNSSRRSKRAREEKPLPYEVWKSIKSIDDWVELAQNYLDVCFEWSVRIKKPSQCVETSIQNVLSFKTAQLKMKRMAPPNQLQLIPDAFMKDDDDSDDDEEFAFVDDEEVTSRTCEIPYEDHQSNPYYAHVCTFPHLLLDDFVVDARSYNKSYAEQKKAVPLHLEAARIKYEKMNDAQSVFNAFDHLRVYVKDVRERQVEDVTPERFRQMLDEDEHALVSKFLKLLDPNQNVPDHTRGMLKRYVATYDESCTNFFRKMEDICVDDTLSHYGMFTPLAGR
jgi:hypothetical protein